MNCEEEMREKKEMGKGGCMCVLGEKKKEREGGTWMVGKKKKRNEGVGFTCMVRKKRGVEKKEEKNFEREKTKLVLFVSLFCLVQSIEL